jgi:hypothetical protein
MESPVCNPVSLDAHQNVFDARAGVGLALVPDQASGAVNVPVLLLGKPPPKKKEYVPVQRMIHCTHDGRDGERDMPSRMHWIVLCVHNESILLGGGGELPRTTGNKPWGERRQW